MKLETGTITILFLQNFITSVERVMAKLISYLVP